MMMFKKTIEENVLKLRIKFFLVTINFYMQQVGYFIDNQ